ncbi:MAG: hypothetical protein AB7G21_01370 [Dehalococcoidia bacterium]
MSSPPIDTRPFRERIASLSLDALDFDAANEALKRAGLGDGLPVIPPTAARVDAMLAGGGRAAIEAGGDLGLLMPSFVAPSAWDVAACAVMAGARSACLPVIAEALRALAEPAFNLLGVQTTTGSATPVIIVSGPLARDLEVNAGANAMGQGARANATIGRAVRLVLQDVGLAIPGSGDMATLGQPGKFGWCFAETPQEDGASPWPPLHAVRGLAASESAVTVVAVGGSVEAVLSGTGPEAMVEVLAPHIALAGRAVVVLPPESARAAAAAGWDRARFQHALAAAAGRAHAALTALPASTDARPLPAAPVDDLLVVVAGGVGVKAAVLPFWGGETEAVTRPLPGR